MVSYNDCVAGGQWKVKCLGVRKHAYTTIINVTVMSVFAGYSVSIQTKAHKQSATFHCIAGLVSYDRRLCYAYASSYPSSSETGNLNALAKIHQEYPWP